MIKDLSCLFFVVEASRRSADRGNVISLDRNAFLFSCIVVFVLSILLVPLQKHSLLLDMLGKVHRQYRQTVL